MATLTIHRSFLKMCSFILKSVNQRYNLNLDNYRKFTFDKISDRTYKFTMYSQTIHVYFGVISDSPDGFVISQMNCMQVDNSYFNQ